MKSVLVSACLLGTPCRYDGKSKPCQKVIDLADRYRLVPVCPEVMGGLSTPRLPSEIVSDRVMRRDGADVSSFYREGARQALQIALENDCTYAIMKEKSPSCGKGLVYDGHFDGTLVPGNGVTVALLEAHGITVIGESQLDDIDF